MDFIQHYCLMRNERVIHGSGLGNISSRKQRLQLENSERTLCSKKTKCWDDNHS